MKPYDLFRKVKIDRPISFIDNTIRGYLRSGKKKTYFFLKQRQSSAHQTKNILVVSNLGGIGNSIAATPLVQALRMIYPQAFIIFLTRSGNLFDNWCVPDKVTCDKDKIPDITFDVVCVTYWGYTNAPEWVNVIKTRKLLKPNVWFNAWFLKPERDYNIDMARRLGYKGSIPPEYVTITPAKIDIPTKIIAILPCSNNGLRWQGKRWPYYSELIDILLDKYKDYQIAVIGTDNDDVSNIRFSGSVIDLRGELSLSETAWVLKKSFFVVANDCGPAHIADCVGAKTFVIFGPTCEVKNKLVNKTTHILPKKICSPCQYDKHEQCNNECIKNITAKEVFCVIEETLNEW